ncbi:MAG: F0F1 ATP synthase subunit gamma [Hyphomicrobiaceae bacterium]
MDDVARLEARMASLGELRDLFTAMQTLAASRVQAAQTALASARAYTEAIERAIADAAALQNGGRAAPRLDDGRPSSVLIVICSEHGFAGAFNRTLLERARSAVVPGDEVAVIGRRGSSIAREHGITPAWTMPMATHVDGIPETARRLAAKLGESETIRAVHGHSKGGASFDAELRQILPLPSENLTQPFNHAAPLHHLPPMLLLKRLVGELLLAELVLVLAESFASENAARLQIMQSASRNAASKLDDLTRRSHQSRQEAITAELLEVVAGGEAVTQRRN